MLLFISQNTVPIKQLTYEILLNNYRYPHIDSILFVLNHFSIPKMNQILSGLGFYLELVSMSNKSSSLIQVVSGRNKTNFSDFIILSLVSYVCSHIRVSNLVIFIKVRLSKLHHKKKPKISFINFFLAKITKD